MSLACINIKLWFGKVHFIQKEGVGCFENCQGEG